MAVLASRLQIPPGVCDSFPLLKENRPLKADQEAAACLTDLTLNLTSECNLRCVYCWNDQGKYSNRQFLKNKKIDYASSGNRKMSLETAIKAVDILVANRGRDRDLVVDFYGGEPLLNTDTLYATVDYCRQNQERWKVNFHFLLATNGTLLSPQTARKLFSQGVQIAVSIDGPRAVHDKNRPFIDKSGSFETIIANLKRMPRSIMKRLVGRTTVTPLFPDMVKLYEHLKSLGFERIEIFESEDACHKILPGQGSSFFSSKKNYKSLFKSYEKLALKYIDDVVRGQLNYSKTFFNRFFKLMQRLYYGQQVSGGCPAAKGQIAVSIEGQIYPCTSFLGIDEFNLGHVDSGIDRNKYKKFIKRTNKRFLHCQSDCHLFNLCRSTGSCLNVNYFFNGDPSLPHKKSCELFNQKLALATSSLAVLSERVPEQLERLFGFDPVGRRGNKLY